MKTSSDAMTIRPYQPSDEAAVVELLQASMGEGPAGRRTATFFRWKHLVNPFGPSLLLLGEHDGELVGLRAFMRWRFRAGGATLTAARAVDTATIPSWRGRGVFSTLTLAALEVLAQDTDLIFNTPNDKSLPGYLKMGWREVGRIPVWVKPARPLRTAARMAGRAGMRTAIARAAEPAAAWAPDASDARIQTDRSPAYIRWRYAEAPVPGYTSIASADGEAYLRVRPRGRLTQATLCDLTAPTPAAARRLLRATARTADADVIACHAAAGTVLHRAVRTAGFVRIKGPILVTRPLRPGVLPEPTSMANWSLSAGDLELF